MQDSNSAIPANVVDPCCTAPRPVETPRDPAQTAPEERRSSRFRAWEATVAAGRAWPGACRRLPVPPAAAPVRCRPWRAGYEVSSTDTATTPSFHGEGVKRPPVRHPHHRDRHAHVLPQARRPAPACGGTPRSALPGPIDLEGPASSGAPAPSIGASRRGRSCARRRSPSYSCVLNVSPHRRLDPSTEFGAAAAPQRAHLGTGARGPPRLQPQFPHQHVGGPP